MQTILLVDPGDKIHQALPLFLSQAGFRVVYATNLAQATEPSIRLSLNTPIKIIKDAFTLDEFDVLSLDIDQIPVFIVRTDESTSNTTNSHLSKSLDYSQTSSTTNRVLGPLELYLDQGIIKYKGKRLNLTPREFSLISFLSANPGLLFSRDELLAKIWSDVIVGTGRTVDQHVSQLRSYMGGQSIETIRGRGYRLNPDFFHESDH